MNKLVVNFFKEEDGLGTVEIVIIIAVLVGLALIFRRAIFSFVNQILTRIFDNSGEVTGTPGTADQQERTIPAK